jgi:polysaccharide export outer membrane protein
MFKMRLSGKALLLIFMAVCGPSYAQTTPSNSSQTNAAQATSAPNPNVPALQERQERYPRYQVMPSDVLAVSFPLIPELQPVSLTVQPDGFINLPNGVGAVYVKGDTVPQIADILTKAYSKTMHNPIVAVDITNFQPPLFTVNGQVGKPGQYPLRVDTTVAEGIAVAGGFLPTAKTQVFVFHRISADWAEVKKLNLKDLLTGHNIKEDIHLQAGDMIFVPDTFIAKFRKYVPYSVGTGSAVGWSGNALVNQ